MFPPSVPSLCLIGCSSFLPHQICDLVHGSRRLARLAGLRLLRLRQQEWGAGCQVMCGQTGGEAAWRRRRLGGSGGGGAWRVGMGNWELGEHHLIVLLVLCRHRGLRRPPGAGLCERGGLGGSGSCRACRSYSELCDLNAQGAGERPFARRPPMQPRHAGRPPAGRSATHIVPCTQTPTARSRCSVLVEREAICRALLRARSCRA